MCSFPEPSRPGSRAKINENLCETMGPLTLHGYISKTSSSFSSLRETSPPPEAPEAPPATCWQVSPHRLLWTWQWTTPAGFSTTRSSQTPLVRECPSARCPFALLPFASLLAGPQASGDWPSESPSAQGPRNPAVSPWDHSPAASSSSGFHWSSHGLLRHSASCPSGISSYTSRIFDKLHEVRWIHQNHREQGQDNVKTDWERTWFTSKEQKSLNIGRWSC